MADNAIGKTIDVLLAELERLDSIDVHDSESLSAECRRAQSVQAIAKATVEASHVTLDVARLRAEWAGSRALHVPKALEG